MSINLDCIQCDFIAENEKEYNKHIKSFTHSKIQIH